MNLTVLYIILAGITALFLALFQYLYKSKKRKLNRLFAFLRFITLFALFLILINPKVEKVTFYNEKPQLVVAFDNSESVKHLEQNEKALAFKELLKSNRELENKFDINYYSFEEHLNSSDSLDFTGKQTNITALFSSLKQVYKDKVAPTILISDGNQTFGSDYEYTISQYEQPIFPVILGDTITYVDLKIQQLNVNKYAYLKNQFPVEIIAVYSGDLPVSSELRISSGNTVLYRQALTFSKSENSKTITALLPANRTGVNSYRATLVPLSSEKNKNNNSKPFAVDVIDQKTNVAIVSSMSHPDLGALKKAIETNEQRSVRIISPDDYLTSSNDYQVVILYQPTSNFDQVFKLLDSENLHRFIITGTKTDWRFLNSVQESFKQTITSQEEEFQAAVNTNFSTFIIDDNLAVEEFPPLHSEFGGVSINIPYETLFFKRINNVTINEPLMATIDHSNVRETLLFGEGIWRWRAQSYLNSGSFKTFDDFIGKLIQYLTSSRRKSRLNVDYESFYTGSQNVLLSAQFFNKNFEFDNKASLNISLKNTIDDSQTSVPFILKQNKYEVNLSNLPAGTYDFTVTANGGEASYSGRLEILDFSVEQQFLNANVTKLETIATNSGGKRYFIENTEDIFQDLITDTRFATIQKSSKNVVPLIDFKLLLALIVLSLAVEWFLRKYNGLI